MWLQCAQIAILALALLEIKGACYICTIQWNETFEEQVKHNLQLSTLAFPLALIATGNYILFKLFRQHINWTFVGLYYAGFGVFVIFRGWLLALYYIPVFVAHFLSYQMIPNKTYAVYAIGLSLLLLGYVNIWWFVAFAFGLHGTMIATFMYLLGKPLLRTPGTLGYHTHILLGKYFCFSTNVWSIASKYIF